MEKKPMKRNDMSDVVHRIKTTDVAGRRDYNEEEIAMIRAGREADAKIAWHERKGAPHGR